MRLVSLAPSNTEILFALGLGDEVVSVTHFCDWPLGALRKPRIGAWLNTEPAKIKEVKPDIIFTSYYLPEPLREWNGPGELVHVEPKTLEGVYESIMQIGEKVNRLRQAHGIIARMKEEFAEIAAHASKARPKVYMEEWFAPPMAGGNWVPEIVEIAGGIPGIAEKGKPSASFPIEALAAFDPDVMIFHWCGVLGDAYAERLKERSREWGAFRALENGNHYFIDDALLNRPGPRLTEAARKVQRVLRHYGETRLLSASIS